MESLTDPGNKDQYKIQRVQVDPGTEFRGNFERYCAAENIVLTRGGVKDKKAQCYVEGAQGTLQPQASAQAINCFMNEDFAILARGNLFSHAADVKLHTKRRGEEKSIYEQQIVCEPGFSENWLKRTPTFGWLIFGYLKKDKRNSKVWGTAVMGYFAGWSKDTPDAAIITPFTEQDDVVTLYPDIECTRYVVFPDVFPLKSKFSAVEFEKEVTKLEKVDIGEVFTTENLESHVVCSGDEYYIPTSNEVTAILKHTRHYDDETEYLCIWEGKERWFYENQLCENIDLVQIYEDYAGENGAYMCSNELEWEFMDLMQQHNMLDYSGGAECPTTEWLSEANREKSIKAMEAEKQAMLECRWTKVDASELSPNQKKYAAKVRYVNVIKRDGRHKSRIVLTTPEKGIRVHTDVSAGVPPIDDWRLVVADTDLEIHEVGTTDFVTCFLQTKKYTHGRSYLVKLFNPATQEWEYYLCYGPTYGGSDVPKTWKVELKEYLRTMGFQESMNAPSMYHKESTGAIISCHVDDPWIRTNKRPKGEQSELTEIYLELKKQFELQALTILTPDTPIDYLSMRMSVDAAGNICLDNDAKVKSILTAHDMLDCNPVKTPLSKHHLKDMADDKAAENFLEDDDIRQHQSDTGSDNWLQMTTHPNLTVSSSLMAGFNKAPVKACKAARKHILRFLKGTLGQALVSLTGNKSGLRLTVDSDWAGMHSITGETRSRCGISIFYNGMLIAWKSFLINCVSLSSAEAELYALSELLKMARHISYVARDLGIDVPAVLPLETDSAAALGFCCAEGASGKMKHIDMRSDWVQDLRNRNLCRLLRVPGNENPSDFMTKVHPAPDFQRLEEVHLTRNAII